MLSCAIWVISVLAWATEVPMSCSTLVRSDWMPCVVVFSCCASVCAADNAVICADEPPGSSTAPASRW